MGLFLSIYFYSSYGFSLRGCDCLDCLGASWMMIWRMSGEQRASASGLIRETGVVKQKMGREIKRMRCETVTMSLSMFLILIKADKARPICH